MVKLASLKLKPNLFCLKSDGNHKTYLDFPVVKDFWWDDVKEGFLKPLLYDAILDFDGSNVRILPYVYADEFAVVSFTTDKPVLLLKSWNSSVKNVQLPGLGYLQVIQVCQDWDDIYVIYKDGYDVIDMKIFKPYMTHSAISLLQDQKLDVVKVIL
jgi:hypothetical protein